FRSHGPPRGHAGRPARGARADRAGRRPQPLRRPQRRPRRADPHPPGRPLRAALPALRPPRRGARLRLPIDAGRLRSRPAGRVARDARFRRARVRPARAACRVAAVENLPTRFASLLDLARLPWFARSEEGRLVLRDRSVGPIADLHTHLAMAYVRPPSVDLHALHPETQHYLPACCAVDLDVYAN